MAGDDCNGSMPMPIHWDHLFFSFIHKYMHTYLHTYICTYMRKYIYICRHNANTHIYRYVLIYCMRQIAQHSRKTFFFLSSE